MIQLIYTTMPVGLFVSFNKVLELGIGNVACILVVSVLLYLLFEWPLRRLNQIYIYPYLSHDEILHEAWAAE